MQTTILNILWVNPRVRQLNQFTFLPLPVKSSLDDKFLSDFRQFSVLSQVAKVLERIQLKLNQADLKMDANQHAFMSRKSTVTALTSITQDQGR